MTSRSGSCKATPTIGLGSRSYKSVVGSVSPTSRSNNKFNELVTLEKGTPAPDYVSTPALSYASASALAESTLALKYSEADLMKILKIFSKTKGQESKAKISHKQSLKVKVPNIYFAKLQMDCYHFCQ